MGGEYILLVLSVLDLHCQKVMICYAAEISPHCQTPRIL